MMRLMIIALSWVAFTSQLPAKERPPKADHAKRLDKKKTPAYSPGFEPTHRGLKYGAHKLCFVDFWKVESDKPAPLIIYIHGGGFLGGSVVPRGGGADIIGLCRKKGVAFASVEYPKLDETKNLTIILRKIGRAVQYLRANAQALNIDKSKVVCYGGSAGAGASLWLAVHDDLADPENNDPVLRESTRPFAVMVIACQATYNILRWPEVLEKRGAYPRRHVEILMGYYSDDPKVLAASPNIQETAKETDMLAMMDKDDASVYVHMKAVVAGNPVTDILHDARHGRAIRDRAKTVGLECLHSGYDKDIPDNYTFLFQKLGAE